MEVNLVSFNYRVDALPEKRLVREKLASLEAVLRQHEQVECPLRHSFADGCYIREIFIPADTIVVGKIHRHSHYNHLTQGEVTVFTKDGLQHFKAPYSMISTAGTKRAVYTHTDTIWTTVHVTDKTDLEEIEHEIICTDYEELDQLEELKMQAQHWLSAQELP